MTPAEDGLLQAISDYLTPNMDQRTATVRIAIAGLHGWHWDPLKVAEFTAAFHAETPPGTTGWTAVPGGGPHAFTPACQSCGAATDLDPVHFPAAIGLAARVEYYCHQPGPCAARRHDHLAATSLGVTA